MNATALIKKPKSLNMRIKPIHDLKRTADFDPLTGLYSKDQFFYNANEYDKTHPSEGVDAIVLNYNKFHLINELYGRNFGDKVLCVIGDCVRNVALEHGGFACRYDADIFYMYINHQSNYEFLTSQVSSKLAAIMKTPDIRVRIGIYPDINRNASLQQRFDRAIQACNSANKSSHSASYEIYDETMHKKELYEAVILDSIGDALNENQFNLVFQPKYYIQGDSPSLSSAEVLIRWQHPEVGTISPDFFIPLFEKNGLIKQLDRYVWREAAKQIRKWKDEFGQTVPVSVNVSRVDIFDDDLIEYLKAIIIENGIFTSDLHLEITETAYTENVSQIVSVVNQLRKAGFQVEMDDFGKGYSSFNMLTTLPLDALKLDIGFIKNIAENNKEMNLLGCILKIAKLLNLTVIAEGVENSTQYKLLKDVGCDMIQGYYLSKPLSSDDFKEVLSSSLH